MRLHEQFRKLRGNFPQAELARRAGVPRGRLVEFEKGGNITVATLEKAAAVLGLQIVIVPRGTSTEHAIDARETLAAIGETRQALDKLERTLQAKSEEPALPPLPEAPVSFAPAVTADDPTVRRLLDEERRGPRAGAADEDEHSLS